MKIKLDENIPASFRSILQAKGHDVDTVPEEGLAAAKDSAVWSVAKAAQRFLITQDLDFSDIRQFTPGTHPGILLIRLIRPDRRNLTATIIRVLDTCDLDSLRGSVAVVTETKLRIRHS